MLFVARRGPGGGSSFTRGFKKITLAAKPFPFPALQPHPNQLTGVSGFCLSLLLSDLAELSDDCKVAPAWAY